MKAKIEDQYRTVQSVLTDLEMPDMDGWTLAVLIKDQSPKTPVVLITGSDKNDVMKKFKGSCVDSVMFKPLGMERIEETVQTFLARIIHE